MGDTFHGHSRTGRSTPVLQVGMGTNVPLRCDQDRFSGQMPELVLLPVAFNPSTPQP